MRMVRSLLCIGCMAAALTACSRAPLRPVVPSGPTAVERLAAADRLVRAGCLDCLFEAHREYQALRYIASAGNAATMGAIRTAGLIALRQRELGMVDEGYLAIAKDLIAATPDLPAWIGGVLDVAAVLPTSIAGASRPAITDAELEKSRILRTNRDVYTGRLREFAPIDELVAYAWATLICGSIETRDVTAAEVFSTVATFRDSPLLQFKEATCRGVQLEKLTALMAADPRWAEMAYLQGMYEVGRRKLDAADTQFAKAYAWRPRWPSLTQSMANVAMTGEEFATALRLYDETLTADPKASDALLGKIKALTYLGQAVEAIAASDQLLAANWHPGEARYWRALNESQLERYDAAWVDVEEAAKLLINSDVPKLAGIIAYRRRQLDVARERFELSRYRNQNDCEAAFYLGVVLAEQAKWERTAAVSREASSCLEAAEQEAIKDIAAIRVSTDPPERQARQIARREQTIANGRRMMATSWFNAAVGYYNLSRKDEARKFAEKVADDEQFGERAREILSRLSKQP
jgi:tetratricopeptide (TPR) repeat protein